MAKQPFLSRDQIMTRCNAMARQRLLHRRIVEVRYLSPEECRRLMWDHTSIVFLLDDGTTVYAARDAEGNDAGALHGVSGSGQDFVLPEILNKPSS